MYDDLMQRRKENMQKNLYQRFSTGEETYIWISLFIWKHSSSLLNNLKDSLCWVAGKCFKPVILGKTFWRLSVQAGMSLIIRYLAEKYRTVEIGTRRSWIHFLGMTWLLVKPGIYTVSQFSLSIGNKMHHYHPIDCCTSKLH